MDIENLRKEYRLKEFDESVVQKDPFLQFYLWMQEAIQANIIEPNAMTLCTVSKEGRPSSRTVLLKKFDASGFAFFTNYESRKAQQIKENPYVSLTFFWKELERQVCIEGKVEKVSQEESEAYFKRRQRGSQLGAWASIQDAELSNREGLENAYRKYDEQFKDQDIPLPPYWGGFRVVVNRMEFWQGRENRLHDRFRFIKEENDDSWSMCRLSP